MAMKASTRLSSKPVKSPRRSETEQDGCSETVRELVVHVARVQLASITAATRFITGWVQSADRYAQAISDELLDRMHGETPPGQLIGRLATASGAHLREITALPAVAVSHFRKGNPPCLAHPRLRPAAISSASGRTNDRLGNPDAVSR
jgi:hypothetical protein